MLASIPAATLLGVTGSGAAISVVDLAGATLTTTIELPDAQTPERLAVNATTGVAVVAEYAKTVASCAASLIARSCATVSF